MTNSPANIRGFSLIELMVSMVAGLIVIGAVGSFAVSSMRSNAEYVQATRLTQELRATMDFVNRELRRAGYDESAMTYVARPASSTISSPFARMLVNIATAGSHCIIYAYDRSPGTSGVIDLANGEIRGLRRASRVVNGVTVGVVEFAESSTAVLACNGASPDYTTYPPTCSSAGWCALSDPRQIDITRFTITDSSQTVAAVGTNLGMKVRDLELVMEGALLGVPDVVRGSRSSVRVRADCLRTTLSDCDVAPAP